jgi:hypothetical protein
VCIGKRLKLAMNNLFVEKKHEHDVSVYRFFVNECVELFYAISVSYMFVICLHMKWMTVMYVHMSICFRQMCQFFWCDFCL